MQKEKKRLRDLSVEFPSLKHSAFDISQPTPLSATSLNSYYFTSNYNNFFIH
jgi:hypothetical protein